MSMSDVTVPTRGLFVRADAEFAPGSNPSKLHYGIAAADLDGDGEVEFVVAGYNGPNLVLKWDSDSKRLVDISSHPAYAALRDPEGAAIGVACGDVDGDGVEEIYILNTNGAYAGSKSYGDKLFKRGPSGVWYDVLEDADNAGARNQFAGRSVAMVDRLGTGRYSVYVSNYASLPSLFGAGHRDRGLVGAVKLLEMDSAASAAAGKLIMRDVAAEVGVRAFTGGRGVTAAPLLPHAPGAPTTDILAVNERGPNFLFRNDGPGKGFTDVAAAAGLADEEENGRGVAVVDLENRGVLSIVYGNWMGPHRMMLRRNSSAATWSDVATPAFAEPSPVRTVLAADFANEGRMALFVNNIAYRGPSPNRLFRWAGVSSGSAVRATGATADDDTAAAAAVGAAYQPAAIGDALEPHGHGTGAAYADIDGDGNLELLVAHGESAEQPLSFYRVAPDAAARPVVQIAPLTPSGAPARGALVTARWSDGSRQAQVIDGGSGYLCEMWPVAHFAAQLQQQSASADASADTLSAATSESASGGAGAAPSPGAASASVNGAVLEGIDITWPDGVSVSLPAPLPNHRLTVSHPSAGAAAVPASRPLSKTSASSA